MQGKEKGEDGEEEKGFAVDDRVKIIGMSINEAREKQTGHGGWVSDMEEFLGKEGVVVRLLEKSVRVSIGGKEFVWNPTMLELVKRAKRLEVGQRVILCYCFCFSLIFFFFSFLFFCGFPHLSHSPSRSVWFPTLRIFPMQRMDQ